MPEVAISIGNMVHSEGAEENPELSLMLRLRQGDSAAMNDLVHRYGPALRQLVGRLTNWSSDGDDILQEVFLTAWQKAGQYRGHGSLEGWLRKLAVNRCRNHHRARAAFSRFLERIVSWKSAQSNTENGESMGMDEESPMQLAMMQLKADERTVLVLYYLEELSGREVAEIMSVRIESVHMRLSRARKALREKLRQQQERADG